MTSLQKSLSVIGLMLFVFYILTHIEFHRTTKHNVSEKHEHEELKKNKQLEPSPPAPKEEQLLHVIEKVISNLKYLNNFQTRFHHFKLKLKVSEKFKPPLKENGGLTFQGISIKY